MNHIGLNTTAPARRIGQVLVLALPRQNFCLETNTGRKLIPEGGKLTGLKHQNVVACAQGVDKCSFPSAST